MLNFIFYLGAKLSVLDRVIHVGKHEILPDENAKLIAQFIKIRRLVDHGAADTQHVQASVARELKCPAQCRSLSMQREKVGSSPTRAPAKHRNAVDDELNPTVGLIDRDSLKADGTSVDTKPLVIYLYFQLPPEKSWRAVCVGPPQWHIGDGEITLYCRAVFHVDGQGVNVVA